jgi:hypothetical protein
MWFGFVPSVIACVRSSFLAQTASSEALTAEPLTALMVGEVARGSASSEVPLRRRDVAIVAS